MLRQDAIWVGVFMLLILGMGLGTWTVRQRLLHHYSAEQAAERWQAWRQATESMAVAQGPTVRHPVSTELPPSYILLRDHFAACLGGVVITSGVFFGVILWMLRGVLRGHTQLPATPS